jgi:hypothetical protein
MKTIKIFQTLLLIALLPCSPLICRAEITIVLSKGFVKQYKDKATIATTFRVDKHHNKPNDIGTGSNDGDIHIAGRDTVVRLPMVAEIINGRKEKEAMKFLLQTSLGQQVSLTGVWRLWFEHPGQENQVQGEEVSVPDDSNPNHLFELHPVTEFAGFNCLDSFLPIKNDNVSPAAEFRGKDAKTAFTHYEGREATITTTNTAIMITSNKAVYNYAEFVMKLAGKPKDVGDGYIVSAKIYSVGDNDNDRPIVERNRRMIFAKGSPPAEAVSNLVKGDTLHVLGIPRVNLNQVFAIVSNLGANEEYTDLLPYEMIIVAILPA